MSSRWSYFMKRMNRSLQQWAEATSSVMRMEGTSEPYTGPKMLVNLSRPSDLQQLAIGCDADIGGSSSAHLDFVAEPDSVLNTEGERQGYARFWGDMRLNVRSGMEGKMRSGYAGFRTKPLPTLFGEITHDLSMHKYLALRVKLGSYPRTRDSWYVNVQTESAVSGEIWQQKLPIKREDGGWEDVYVPISSFILTSYAQKTESQNDMTGERVRWFGVSMLGGNSGIEGAYELGIQSITAVNDFDSITENLETIQSPVDVAQAAKIELATTNRTDMEKR